MQVYLWYFGHRFHRYGCSAGIPNPKPYRGVMGFRSVVAKLAAASLIFTFTTYMYFSIIIWLISMEFAWNLC